MRDRAIATHRADLVACDVVSNAIGKSVDTAGARVGAVTFKEAALSAKMSLRVRASTMFPCRATRYSPYRAGPAHLTPVIERCPHIRGVAVRKILTCAHALE
jgi:hypothetical protein